MSLQASTIKSTYKPPYTGRVKIPFRKLEHYGKEGERLGKGAFGTVTQLGTNYAVKKFKGEGGEEGITADVLREVAILRKTDHPNIVKMYDILGFKIATNAKIKMVLELGQSDLSSFLKKVTMEPDLIKSYMYQLSRGLLYLHDNDIWHRDLKPANILIFTNGKVVISDFGISRCDAIPGDKYTHEVQSAPWRAPEILLGADSYGPKIDNFSLGVIFAEMCTRKKYFFDGDTILEILKMQVIRLGNMTEEEWPGISGFNMYKEVSELAKQFRDNRIKGFIPNWETLIGKEGLDLMTKLMTPNPSKRITMREAVDHPYFNDVRETINRVLSYDDRGPYFCGKNLTSKDGIKDPLSDLIVPDSTTTDAIMYQILYGWMSDVCVKYKLSPETFLHARNLVSHYILNIEYVTYEDVTPVNTRTLQRIGTAALSVSSKLLEIYTPAIREFAYITDNSVSVNELIMTEFSIAKVLNFNFAFPLVSEYIYYIGKDNTHTVRRMAVNLARLYAIKGDAQSDVEELAYSCLYVAIQCSDEEFPECFNDKIAGTAINANKIVREMLEIDESVIKTFKQTHFKVFELLDKWETCKYAKGYQEDQDEEVPDKGSEFEKAMKDLETTMEALETNEGVTIYKGAIIIIQDKTSESISRARVADYLSTFLLNEAQTSANNGMSEYFIKYFKLIREMGTNKYIKTVLPSNVRFSWGALTYPQTNITIELEHVNEEYETEFNNFLDTLPIFVIPVESDLPGGWTTKVSRNDPSVSYYYNTKTGQTQPINDPDVVTNALNVNNMSLEELKVELKKRNLPVGGNKNTLITRLKKAIMEERKLPPGWTTKTSRNDPSLIYYYNTKTGQTQFAFPE